ncbi:MAG: hypothetical protein DWQ31_13485 [Planctomycetota bacterium]|nr:MAG: hypothetical protein DWQ31_13485 [Planctomycetota bacterium]REJ86905.1 MAG: hypothetical protein DWQ35_22250 [Planctomycetota bacterium]REK26611.1 MAG: hypothetical protein DWQ42_08575 [Planctomycetota bacterium]REK38418.1 MAG: hypothetical protein DWQ46_20525 [Planctomycetota bacterium]
MSQADASHFSVTRLTGRSFIHPLFDYLVIGGGISLIATIVIWQSGRSDIVPMAVVPLILLLSNSAHFAASTVRLYTKRGSFEALPFLTMAFPCVCLLLIALCLAWPLRLGMNLQSLYLTWSPYHYAAQAYGLAVMYAYRSGCLLTTSDKRLLFWCAMIPFLRMFFCIQDTVLGADIGLAWIAPSSLYRLFEPYQAGLDRMLLIAACAAPLVLLIKTWRSSSGAIPMISLLMLVTNTVWFFALEPINAFVWATVFHGLQYLAIVVIFHVRDRLSEPTNRHGKLYHALWFYGWCVLLAYALFFCLPQAYQMLGFGVDESVWVVIAAINVHHFIVDGYIWRLKKGDSNRQVVDSSAPAAAPRVSSPAGL